MGAFAGPDVKEDGLVLAVDAGNTKSYDKYENLLTNTSTASVWASGTITNESTYPILGLNTVRVTDLSTDGDSPNLSGTSINAGTYTVSHYIDTVNSTCSTFIFALFTFHADNGGFVYSYVNSAFTLSTKTFGSFTYYGPAWSNATATATNVGGGIYRLSITATTSLAGTGIRAYVTPSPADTSYAIIAGSQYERGSSATDYYQTTGTPKTRGTTWTDLSGNGNTGTLTNGPTYNSANSGSLVFDGVNDFVLLSSNTTFGNNTTWEAWIYATANVSTYNMFMGRFLPYFGFYTGNRFIFSNLVGGTQRTIQTATTNLSLNTWYHATFTTSYDGANTTMKIYTNGVETTTGTFVGTQGNYSNPFMIGDGNNGNTTWYPFAGRVSNVKIYNKTLSTTEIQQNYNATKSRYGL